MPPKSPKPDPNDAATKYSGTDQGKDARLEERRKKGVYGAGPEDGPGYEREDKKDGGRYGVERTVDRAEDEGSSEDAPNVTPNRSTP